ncbi:MFS transporter [Paraburkholderia susongensis]|uniref:Major Facilitator Superfamily protein n=1 Tax=Paraburkholderia susongensis TaxID=1515439 RepID=A0A1X7LLY1_9BURK|nr:MFS transporter [Paraburkholderia susongensis]SMG54898.1 Major Facilitator Superfamily protein [Paraburkholderia susongensis]
MFAKTHATSPAFSRDIRVLLRMQGVMNASHFMTVPLLALYMSMTLRFSPVALASVMSANLLSAQVLPLIAGAVADRFGSRRMMALGLWLRGLGFLGFGVTNNVAAWVCFAFAAGSGVACYEAGLYGIFGRQPKASLSALFAANNQMLNMGVAVGPIIGGLMGLVDARFAFAGSTFLFGLLGATVFRLKVELSETSDRRPVLSSLRAATTNRNLWRLIVAAFPWFFLFPQLYVAFPLYAGRLAGPHAASAVYVVNGVIGLVFMLAAKRWLIRIDPVTSTMYAYLAAAIAFTSVAAFDGLGWFLLFIAGYTIIETIMLPALETLTASLAIDGSQGTFFGTLSAAGALGGAAGYYSGSWLILNGTTLETWVIFGSVGAIGFAVSALILPAIPRQMSLE